MLERPLQSRSFPLIAIEIPVAPLSGKGNIMETASDPYADTALCYIALVNQVSRAAAAALEQIYTNIGSHAALRAALMITILKMEVVGNHWIPNINLYDGLLDDFPTARPLARLAMNCWLQSWSAAATEPGEKAALAIA